MSKLVPVNARDHIRGSAQAPVVMIEYGDFECPACGQAYFVVKELESTFGDTLAVVFRHFPLATVHPHAALAAEAAEAAHAQKRFWEMHDLLFENQRRLSVPDLLAYAATLGLDGARFARELSEHKHADKVHDDFMSGVRAGVSGTPTFFVNGMKQTGVDVASLLAAISTAAAVAGTVDAAKG